MVEVPSMGLAFSFSLPGRNARSSSGFRWFCFVCLHTAHGITRGCVVVRLLLCCACHGHAFSKST